MVSISGRTISFWVTVTVAIVGTKAALLLLGLGEGRIFERGDLMTWHLDLEEKRLKKIFSIKNFFFDQKIFFGPWS